MEIGDCYHHQGTPPFLTSSSTTFGHSSPEASALLIRIADVACGFAIPDSEEAKGDYKAVRGKWKLPDVAGSLSDMGEMKKAGEELCRGLSDRRAVFVDLVACMMKHAEPGRVGLLITGTLSDVAIEGDQAKGKVLKENGRTKAIRFRKRGDAWFISYEQP